MTLRVRLVISITLLLLAATATVGVASSASIRRILVDEIDRTLTAFDDRSPRLEGPEPGVDPPAGAQPPPGATPDDGFFLRPFAEIEVDSSGTVVVSRPAGFADEPLPLPDVDQITAADGLQFVDSVDGTLEYRVSVTVADDGSFTVRGAPLDDVASAEASLISTVVTAGVAVLLLGAAATWWAVRSSLAPVDRMIDTATAIAGGDLGQRIPDLPPATELGRLGSALNGMLAHIEESIESERDGQERLRRFVADASHELRTPVAAISGYAELHRSGGLPTAEAEDDAWQRIEKESKRMARLVEDLLTLARLGQPQALHRAEANVAQIARDAATDHAAIDQDRPVVVQAPNEAMAPADGERIHQVIGNLLSNARVHTPSGTTITVNVHDHPDRVDVEVADDGPGIPTAALPHVFDRFYRADPSRSRRSGGSGLGLSIVQAIIEAHDGTVTAINESGARIGFSLPK